MDAARTEQGISRVLIDGGVPLKHETVSECHSEAQPKNLLFRKPLEKQMLRGVYPESHRRTQHDIQVISCITTQSQH
jgi:hypothetical protein